MMGVILKHKFYRQAQLCTFCEDTESLTYGVLVFGVYILLAARTKPEFSAGLPHELGVCTL